MMTNEAKNQSAVPAVQLLADVETEIRELDSILSELKDTVAMANLSDHTNDPARNRMEARLHRLQKKRCALEYKRNVLTRAVDAEAVKVLGKDQKLLYANTFKAAVERKKANIEAERQRQEEARVAREERIKRHEDLLKAEHSSANKKIKTCTKALATIRNGIHSGSVTYDGILAIIASTFVQLDILENEDRASVGLPLKPGYE